MTNINFATLRTFISGEDKNLDVGIKSHSLEIIGSKIEPEQNGGIAELMEAGRILQENLEQKLEPGNEEIRKFERQL